MKNHTAVLPTAQVRLPAPLPFQSGSSGSPIRKAVHLGEADRFSYRQRRAEAEGGLSLPHGLVSDDHLGRGFEEKLAVAQQAGITIADGLVPLLAFITMKLAGLPSSTPYLFQTIRQRVRRTKIYCAVRAILPLHRNSP